MNLISTDASEEETTFFDLPLEIRETTFFDLPLEIQETTFFDLPLEIREIVYRRARFMEVRRKVAELMSKRVIATVRENIFTKSKYIFVHAEMRINATKHMSVRRSVNVNANSYSDVCDSVGIVDEDCGVKVVFYTRPDGIDLLLKTRRIETYYQDGSQNHNMID